MEANGIIIKNNNNKEEEEEEEYQYRECLKNHAASLGTHATDGCGEFLPSPATDPANPATLTCAACGCHRNFHRKCSTTNPLDDDNDDNKKKKKKRDHTETAHHLREDEAEAGSHVLLTLKTGGGGEGGGGPAKRFRSKFSKGQKEGMLELAESIGWRIKRREEEVVDQGCTKIGVDRGVFKVWMHNNKQAAKRNQHSKNMVLINGDHHHHDHDHDQHHHHDTN